MRNGIPWQEAFDPGAMSPLFSPMHSWYKSRWQYTRNLIQALTEGIAKSKMAGGPVSRKVRVDAPSPVSGDWQELVEVLQKKGIKSESRRAALKR